jgi:putative RNA 2'-phosphotransferase
MVRLSKWLALVLRHQPAGAGLVLDPAGWADVDQLLAGSVAAGVHLGREELVEVVAANDKRRYELDPSGRRIRARQGHSAAVGVDLGLTPVEPPVLLYHGTVERSVGAIVADGLWPMGRQYVHLSPDVATARVVGGRRGRPVVLEVRASAMAVDGHVFYQSANGVWLVDHVPPDRLARLDP